VSQYRFERHHEDYTHYASANVFASAPGYVSFPVRLAFEIFQTCLDIIEWTPAKGPVILYDPCCGTGHLLAGIAFRFGERISQVVGSDIDVGALDLARKNLSLLDPARLATMLNEIKSAQAEEWRAPRAQRIESACYLANRLAAISRLHPISKTFFQADAADPIALTRGLGGVCPDVIIADFPYGESTRWQGVPLRFDTNKQAHTVILDSIRRVAVRNTVLAIVTRKEDKISHEAFDRLKVFRIGRRRVTYLAPRVGSKPTAGNWQRGRDRRELTT
jgi:23S rRNA (guanine2535-N1)-methyltransferase